METSSSSRSRSRSRRKGKRRKSSRKFETAPKKTVDKDGLNPFATFVGFLLSSVLILLGWNVLFSGTNRATLEVIEKADPAKLRPTDFRSLLKLGDAQQLASTLAKLNQRTPLTSGPTRLAILQQRSAVADKMLTLTLDSQQRQLALNSKIQALAAMIKLNREQQLEVPNVIFALRDLATAHTKDPDDQIRLTANMALATLNVIEHERDAQTTAEGLVALVKEWPRNPDVLEAFKGSVTYHMKNPQLRERGGKLARLMADNEDLPATPELEQAQADFHDFAVLAESEYYDLWDTRNIASPAELRQIKDIAVELLNDDRCGLKLLKHVEEIAHWFEVNDGVEQAASIYEAISNRSDKFTRPATRTRAATVGPDGQLRCRMVNQPINFLGPLADGRALSNDLVGDRIAVVVFWSLGESKSIRALEQLKKESRAWRGNPVQLIAVCIDRLDAEEYDSERINQIQEMLGDPWWMAIRNPDGTLPLLEQCPSDRIPRILVTDSKRRIVRADVPLTEVRAQIGSLLIFDDQD